MPLLAIVRLTVVLFCRAQVCIGRATFQGAAVRDGLQSGAVYEFVVFAVKGAAKSDQSTNVRVDLP